MSKLSQGYELWRGPSHYDKSDVVVLATGFSNPSTNVKTGGMIQVYILTTESDPVKASKALADSGNCGDCKHRHSTGGACYVNLGHGPLAVFKAWKAGKYPKADARALKAMSQRRVRLGAYGDLAALPLAGLKAVLANIGKHTGYSHGWQSAKGKRLELLQAYTLASVDSEVEQLQANAQGWGTFRVMPKGTASPVTTTLRHVQCLNITHNLQCIDCLLCSGTVTGSRINIFIGAHGSRAKRFTV